MVEEMLENLVSECKNQGCDFRSLNSKEVEEHAKKCSKRRADCPIGDCGKVVVSEIGLHLDEVHSEAKATKGPSSIFYRLKMRTDAMETARY